MPVAHHAGVTIHADDLRAGQVFRFSRHTVSEAEIIEFARRWDPVPIHTDPVAAAQGPWGGVIASGLHTMAIYQRLAVAALWSEFTGGVGRSFDVRFRRPVRPGTTLTGSATVASVTPRPGRGAASGCRADVVVDAELTEEGGPAVLWVRLEGLLPIRASGTGPAAGDRAYP